MKEGIKESRKQGRNLTTGPKPKRRREGLPQLEVDRMVWF
jgi:hypothetical protein